MSSTVRIFGALALPLREAEVIWPEEDQHMQEGNVYVGGQSVRSYDVALSIADRAMGEYVVHGRPSRCASARFGDCVHVRLYRRVNEWTYL